jgi:ribose transport system ATP-binding protein
VLGVAGLVGSGREEIAGALFGASPRFAGKVLVGGRKVYATPRESLVAGMAFVPADRTSRGLDPQDRLHEHLLLPRLGPFRRGIRRDHRAGRREAAAWMTTFDVQPPSLYRRMDRFSGGNQQKAVLARWMRTEPRVLLLDEPTQGVDVGAKAAIYRHVMEAAERETAVLVASSDAAELAHLCDRVIVLRSGVIVAELRGAALTEERLIAETFGTTSHRRNLLVNREPIRVRVIRDDTDRGRDGAGTVADGSEPAGGEPSPQRRFGTFRRMIDRLRRRGGGRADR